MRILSVNNDYDRRAFKGFERSVYKAGQPALEENLLHKNNTYFLRSDFSWKEAAIKILDKFKDSDTVSTIIYACSDGRENMSLLIALDSVAAPKEVEKFCPIIARDYDIFAVNKAKMNLYKITEEEKRRINQISNGKFFEYFKPVSKLEDMYAATEKLTSRIVYEVGDFTKEYQTLPKENVLLGARNCWPYFSITNQYTLPRKVCNHFDRNAVLLLGDFDFTTQYQEDFMQNGFQVPEGCDLKNIFIK